MIRVSQIEVFVRVAELSSLTLAAEELRMSTSAVSRSLQALESRLGVRLIERTTRRLWLTEAGHHYLRSCKALLSDFYESESSVRSVVAEPMGTLTVTSSLSFAARYIAPEIPALTQRYPKLLIRLITENRYQNFIEEGIDVAIRTREQEPDSSISMRKLGETRRILAATPAYLQQYGVPTHPHDLTHHKMMTYSLYRDAYDPIFTKGDERQQIKINSVFDSNDGYVLRSAALAHQGIITQGGITLSDDLKTGQLIEVLSDWELSKMTINIAYQSRRYMPAKVRAFIDFMVEKFQKMELY
jgi:DNA-binding transcriptional LysR family regulator